MFKAFIFANGAVYVPTDPNGYSKLSYETLDAAKEGVAKFIGATGNKGTFANGYTAYVIGADDKVAAVAKQPVPTLEWK